MEYSERLSTSSYGEEESTRGYTSQRYQGVIMLLAVCKSIRELEPLVNKIKSITHSKGPFTQERKKQQ